MYDPSVPVYIVDTHALFWYRSDTSRLSAAADAVFRLAATGAARIIVPAIVVAELFYLTLKAGYPVPPSVILADIGRSQEFVFSPLGQQQLERMEALDNLSEIHDRLIAAEALVYLAPIISKDDVLRRSAAVEVIW